VSLVYPRIVAASAAIGLFCITVVIVWSLLPVSTPPSLAILLPLGVLAFLVWVPTLWWAVKESQQVGGSYKRGPWSPVFDRLPRRARTLVNVALVLFAIAFASAVPAIFQGNPELLNGHATLDNHGSVTQVSQQDYEASVAAHARFGSAVLGGFLLLACAAAASRSRLWLPPAS
jgi:hypothetical protein